MYILAIKEFREMNQADYLIPRQIVQPQNTKKKQSIAVKATDSNAVTKVHNTSSIAKSNHLMLSRVNLVVKYEKSISGHRKSDDDGIESPNSGHLKMDGYHIGRISLYQGNFLLNAKGCWNFPTSSARRWGGMFINCWWDLFFWHVKRVFLNVACHKC